MYTTDKLLKTAAIEGGGMLWLARKITADEFWDRMCENFCTKYSVVHTVAKDKALDVWNSADVQRQVYKLICNVKTWFTA